MRIAIAGNIGAGKTSLTKQLSKSLKYKAYYEDVIANPYLDDFYSEMERWSFNLQIYFLNSRFRQILEIQKNGKNIGAVGISGDRSDEDEICAIAGIEAAGLEYCHNTIK